MKQHLKNTNSAQDGSAAFKYLYGCIIIAGILAHVLILRIPAKSMMHVLNPWWEQLSKEFSLEKPDEQKAIPEHRNHIKVSKPPVGAKRVFINVLTIP